jgi:hypothetical protein
MKRLMRRTAAAALIAMVVSIVGALPAWAEPPTNDDVGSAVQVDQIPFQHVTFVAEATTAPDDPDCSSGIRTVWYSFTPTRDMRVDANTFGSNFDTTLSVYTGTRGALTKLDCNDDSSGVKQSSIRFNAQTGTTYLIMVGSLATGTHSTMKLAMSEAPGPPANDKASAATVIDKLPFSVEQDTREATGAAEDDDCAGSTHTVWYSFSTKRPRTLLASAYGSYYSTSLAIYQRTGGSLKQIYCSDEESDYSLRERFRAGEGTYLFRLGSRNDYAGTLSFSLVEPPTPIKVHLKVDRAGKVSSVTGAARLGGTISCSKSGRVSISASIRQAKGGHVSSGGYNGTVDCTTKKTKWRITATDSRRPFATGEAGMRISANPSEEGKTKRVSKIVRLVGCRCAWGT